MKTVKLKLQSSRHYADSWTCTLRDAWGTPVKLLISLHNHRQEVTFQRLDSPQSLNFVTIREPRAANIGQYVTSLIGAAYLGPNWDESVIELATDLRATILRHL